MAHNSAPSFLLCVTVGVPDLRVPKSKCALGFPPDESVSKIRAHTYFRRVNTTQGKPQLTCLPRGYIILIVTYLQYIQTFPFGLPLKRLRLQQNYLGLLLVYHTWMVYEASEPRVREFHQVQTLELKEILRNLDELIINLEHPPLS